MTSLAYATSQLASDDIRAAFPGAGIHVQPPDEEPQVDQQRMNVEEDISNNVLDNVILEQGDGGVVEMNLLEAFDSLELFGFMDRSDDAHLEQLGEGR